MSTNLSKAQKHMQRAQELLEPQSFGAPFTRGHAKKIKLQIKNERVVEVNGYAQTQSINPLDLIAEADLEVIGVKNDEDVGAMIEAKILKLSDRRWGNIEGSKHLEVYIMNKYPENAGNKKVFLHFQNGPLLKIFHWELQEPHTFRSVLGLAESRDMHRLYKPDDGDGPAGKEFRRLLKKYKPGM